MDTKAALEAEPVRQEIYKPDGEEAYNRIEVKLGIQDNVFLLDSLTLGDESAVLFSPDPPALELKVYCPRTRFFISLPAGSAFVSANPPAGSFSPASTDPSTYTASIDDGVLSIKSDNHARVSDPSGETEEEAATASLVASDSSGRSIAITLVAPPYRLVEVVFNVNAEPKITYGDGSDFSSDEEGDCPEIKMPQAGGIVFELVSQQEGARFADEPFDPLPPPDWITDIGTDGRYAFMADLHPDAVSEYSFKIRVSDGSQDWESEDPTIVNVEPTDPPGDPEPPAEG